MFSVVIMGLFFISTWTLCVYGGDGDALFRGAEEAVRLSIRLCGGLCFWCAVMELMEQCGLSRKLAQLFKPVLGRLFPLAAQREEILTALTENVSANLLGLGNAATPAGIRAAKGMTRLGSKGADELCLLVVINTASIQILPSTTAALRASLGADNAFDILPAVWISSFLALTAGLGCAFFLKRVWPS